jgi:hypothetical protein
LNRQTSLGSLGNCSTNYSFVRWDRERKFRRGVKFPKEIAEKL